MNKQDAKKELEWDAVYSTDFDSRTEVVELEKVIDNLSQIDNRPKVKIPQFVADWLEVCKENLAVGLHTAMSPTFMRENSQGLDEIVWMESARSQETFARAWLDGYEVEQEVE